MELLGVDMSFNILKIHAPSTKTNIDDSKVLPTFLFFPRNRLKLLYSLRSNETQRKNPHSLKQEGICIYFLRQCIIHAVYRPTFKVYLYLFMPFAKYENKETTILCICTARKTRKCRRDCKFTCAANMEKKR